MAEDNLPLLTLLNFAELNQFLHECVDDLIAKRHINFDNFKSNDTPWTKDNFEKSVKCIQSCYRRAALEGELCLDESISHNVADAITKCYGIRKVDIQQSILKEALLRKGDCLVENIDWKLKWILGSSNLASLREPLLQVYLHCAYKHDSRTAKKIIQFEADLNQVDSLINVLTELKQELQVSKQPISPSTME